MTTTIVQPKVTVNIVNASVAAQNTAQKILFVVQQTGAATATSGALNTNIPNDGSQTTLHGEGSMGDTLITANKVRNQQVRVDSIGLDDAGGGVDSTGEMTWTGAATEDGSYEAIVTSERNFKFIIAVISGDTATDVAAALVTAIIGAVSIPVSSASSLGAVTITALNAGTYGNSFPLEIRGTVAGLTTSVTGMASGATDPVLTGIFDVIGEQRYQAIVWPYPNDTVEVRALLDPRFNADGAVLDGVAFTALADTVSNLKVLGDALNSQSLLIVGDQSETETDYAGPAIVEIPMVNVSYWAGFRGLRLDTDGFSIADFTITANGPRDSFGSPALASKPYFNVPFADLIPMQIGRGFDATEIEDLKDSGISVLGNNKTNNTVISGEMVTTYKTDAAANPDVTFTFLNFVDTASNVREFFFNNYSTRFAQSRLTLGDVVIGRDMANELIIRSFSKRLYQTLSGPDFVLLQAGENALNFFDTNLVITLDLALGKVTIQMVVPIVTQLREILATIKIAFSTES